MTARLCLIIAVVALIAGFLAVRVSGPVGREAGGDAPFYTSLAQSMVNGRGYVLPRSPWPDRPHLGRLPLWPALVAAGMEVVPGGTEYAVMRWVGIVIHVIGAVLLALLTYCLWWDVSAALIAGTAYALYPTALYLVVTGYPEPAFIMVAVGGLLLILRFGHPWEQGIGAVLSGLAVLARSNYLILPVMMVPAALWLDRTLWRHWKRFVLLVGAFLVFPSAWVLRNFVVSGSFPLMNAMEGETLYGGNNDVVATDLSYWGYWIFPDLIPGQTPKKILAAAMDEAGLNAYYHTRAVEFVKRNWFSYPRLLLGKLVRGFVPLPWRPSWGSYGASALRAALYIAFLWYALKRIVKSKLFKVYLTALFLVILATTVIYYGTPRFTFLLEVFMIPCVAAGLSNDLNMWFGRCYRKSVAKS